HQDRPSNNATTPAITPRARIKLPPANQQQQWLLLDRALSAALASSFTSKSIKQSSIHSLTETLSAVVYSSMCELFGIKKSELQERRQPKPNKRLLELKKAKKELKKARRSAIRKHGKDSVETLSRSWFMLVHEHSSLR